MSKRLIRFGFVVVLFTLISLSTKEVEAISSRASLVETESKKHEYFIYFEELLEKYKKELFVDSKTYQVSSRFDMYDVIKEVEVELPGRFEITSKYYSPKELRDEYEKGIEIYRAETLKNHHTLASYHKMIQKDKVVFKHRTDEYTAKQIGAALDEFSDYLAEEFREKDVEESILNLYDFLYENYSYNAKSVKTMLVGNLANGEMACNGFSRLAYEVLNKMDLETELRAGYSHYWNVIKLEDGQSITFDVTTDIILNKRYKTLGNSTDLHIENTVPVGIYTAEFLQGLYDKVKMYQFKSLEKRNEVWH